MMPSQTVPGMVAAGEGFLKPERRFEKREFIAPQDDRDMCAHDKSKSADFSDIWTAAQRSRTAWLSQFLLNVWRRIVRATTARSRRRDAAPHECAGVRHVP
jgi:hypothetical protein